MPVYEYKCDSCGEIFERIQKFSDEPLKVHDTCGGPVHRLLSAPALQFKGSGWYVTDYAKSGSGGASQSNGTKSESSKEGSSSSTETTTKSESKPAPASTSSEKS